MPATLELTQLAPSPDFRYVGLHPGARGATWSLLTLAGASAAAGMLVAHGLGRGVAAPIALAPALVTAGAIALGGARGRHAPRGATAASLAIVPWGILVESEDQERVLRWAAIRRVHLHLAFGRDQGTPTAKHSLVTVETDRERFTGQAFGAVSLERLVVHLEAYSLEASHRVALDLEGYEVAEGPLEPNVEPLLLAARAYVDSALASGALDLPPAGYRRTSAHAGSRRTVQVVGEVLRDRRAREIDPRAFAAVVAAELHLTELAEDLVALVQSPHPIVAAVAKVAARKLGVARARVGALDEVAPFLMAHDVEALRRWA